MKRQYIIPSVIMCDYQEEQILAGSYTAKSGRITGDSFPTGNNVSATDIGTGDASDAAVKGMWDY